MKILSLAEDGSEIRFWMSVAYDIKNDSVWHPKKLYQEIVDNFGYVPPTTMVSGKNPEHAEQLLVKVWDHYCQWQADCLNYLMDTERYQVILSHPVSYTHLLEGKGYGHGVGMSQWGARAMAEAGKSADEIVHYFFKDVEVTQEYE